jgi:hypothetical protein
MKILMMKGVDKSSGAADRSGILDILITLRSFPCGFFPGLMKNVLRSVLLSAIKELTVKMTAMANVFLLISYVDHC